MNFGIEILGLKNSPTIVINYMNYNHLGSNFM